MNQLGKEQLDLFEGVQLPTLQIKYLLFRSLYEWMLVYPVFFISRFYRCILKVSLRIHHVYFRSCLCSNKMSLLFILIKDK